MKRVTRDAKKHNCKRAAYFHHAGAVCRRRTASSKRVAEKHKDDGKLHDLTPHDDEEEAE